MFERYTEKARRVIFFARAEASEFDSPTIETEHLLLGMLRDKGFLQRYLDGRASEEEIRAAIAKHVVPGPPNSTSLDLPLSNECKYILQFSAEEAERLSHKHIGTEHLIVGMLREENCLAARLLRERGLTLERARAVLAAGETLGGIGSRMGSGTPSARFTPMTIDVVDAESSELLLSWQHGSLIPHIGHTILIHKEGGPDIAYQVRDVVWAFDWRAGGSSLKDVVVSVHKAVGERGGARVSKFRQRPILSVSMNVKTEEEHQQLQKVLGDLVQRDPALSIRTEAGSRLTTLSGMDEWSLQQICERIMRDHKIELDLAPVTVIYLETIRKSAEAEGKYIRQTGGLGNYGHVKIRVEPIVGSIGDPNHADFAFVTDIKGGVVPEAYFQWIEQGVREALRGGVLAGYEVVNLTVTLFDGSYHDIDSNPMAFAIAGSIAVREAARKANPVLLEPVMAVEIIMPEELVGSTMAEINSRRGRIESIERRADRQVIRALVPLAEMVGPGRPAWSMRFASYEPSPFRGGLSDSPANVTQPRRPTMGSGAVRPEKEFEG